MAVWPTATPRSQSPRNRVLVSLILKIFRLGVLTGRASQSPRNRVLVSLPMGPYSLRTRPPLSQSPRNRVLVSLSAANWPTLLAALAAGSQSPRNRVLVSLPERYFLALELAMVRLNPLVIGS